MSDGIELKSKTYLTFLWIPNFPQISKKYTQKKRSSANGAGHSRPQ